MSTTAPVSTPSLASALEARRDTLQLSDQDRALLLETVDRVAPHWPAFLDRLYERLGRHPETSILLQNPEVVTRLKAHQLAYLRTLFTSAHDDEHASQLIRLGHTHYRMRVTPDWYISTYAHFLCDHIDLIADHELLSSNSIAVTNALIRSVFYDIALVLDAYGAGEAEAVSRRHAELVRPPSAAPAPMNLRPTPPPLPPSVPTSTRLRVSGARVTERKTFLGIDAEAGDALARIQPQLAATIPTILSDFYDFITSEQNVSHLLPVEAVERLKSQVTSYWHELSRTDYGRPYAASRARVGVIHERIGLSLQWYLSALARQLVTLIQNVQPGSSEIKALLRTIFFDISFVIDAYMDARIETLLRTDGFANELIAGLTAAVAVVDPAGRVVSANPAMVDLVPGSAALLYQMPISSAVPLVEIDAVLSRVSEQNQKAVAFGFIGRHQYKIMALKLTDRPGIPAGSCALILEDVSDVLRMAQKGEEAQRDVDGLLAGTNAVIFQTDPGLVTIRSISRPVLALTGFRDIYFLGRSNTWMDLIHQDDRQQVRMATQSLRPGASTAIVYRIRTESGDEKWVRSHVTRLADESGCVFDYWASVDITAERYAVELRHERDKAISSAASRLELLTHVSHEIRTPLGVIQGLSELLLKSEGGDRQRDLLEDMAGASGQLQLLARDMLELARIDHGSITIHPSWFLAELVIDQAIAEARSALEDHRTPVAKIMAPALKVWADPLRFHQIVQNLVSNALKYGGESGSVAISLALEQDRLLMQVSDIGSGFSSEVIDRAFDRFPIHGPAVSGTRAAGVGLSLVKQLVEGHGGRVGVRSTPGIETQIWIELPLESAGGEQPGPVHLGEGDHGPLDPDQIF